MMMQRTLFAAMAVCYVMGCSGNDSSAAGDGDAASSEDATSDGAIAHDGALADRSVPEASGGDSSASDAGAGDASLDATSDSATDAGNDAALDAPSDAAPIDASDAGVDCGAVATLHPSPADAGPYCPFSTATPPFLTCAYGQHCCEPPAGMGTLSTCETSCASVADGGTDWQCQDPISCPTGQVCCAIGAYDPNPSCSYGLLRSLRATVCATSCGTGQLRVCESNVECPGGTTCRVVKAKGANFGVCQ